ncbi:MAG: hypothetical protein MMC33_006086 [Icmadophila ericetorum]|nr:hypothetical protein [Icmadophila ericetorum]
MVKKLAKNGEWDELATKTMADLNSLNTIFADMKVKPEYVEEKHLQDIMRNLIEYVQKDVVRHLGDEEREPTVSPQQESSGARY